MSSQAVVDQATLMKEVLETVKKLQMSQTLLASSVDAINGRVNILAGIKEVQQIASEDQSRSVTREQPQPVCEPSGIAMTPDSPPTIPSDPAHGSSSQTSHGRKNSVTSRIILTTYPGQSGINPLPMEWGEKDPHKRGPVVVSRAHDTVRRRNAIGAHGGSYSYVCFQC